MVKKTDNLFIQKITLFLFVIFFAFWFLLQFFRNSDTSLQVQVFSGTYSIVALCGGIFGLIVSRKWGGFKSVIGKSISFLSLGLLAQFFGQISYSLLFIFTKTIPYPSFGDIGYVGSILLYSLGLIYLGKAAGLVYRLKNISNWFFYVILPLSFMYLSYWLFLKAYVFDWSNPVKVVLDFAYPFGETIYISIAISIFFLSRGMLGGLMKSKVLLVLFTLLIQFSADYGFLLFSNYGTVHPAGWNDLLYLFAYYFMTLSLIELLNVYNQIKKL